MSPIDPPLPPRLAATVLMLRDDPFEVLMVRRRAGGAFPGALVFPGGCVEPDDGDAGWLAHVRGADALAAAECALRVAACREVFEEVGVLIGASAPVSAADGFRGTVAAAGSLALDELVPFGHWITPEGLPYRFDTHFYLAAMPAGQIPVADGIETVAHEWVAITEDMVARLDGLHFPTRMSLRRLAETDSIATALAAARSRRQYTVLPVVTREGERTIVTIPAEAGYGVTEDRRP